MSLSPRHSPARAYAFLMAAFTAQNIEEALLPQWASDMTGRAVNRGQFALAVILLTLAAIALGAWGLRKRRDWIPALIAAMLLANSLSHLALSAATQSLMPGAVTGLFLQGPASLWLLHSLCLPPRRILVLTALGLPLQAAAAGLGLATAGIFVD